MNSTKYGKTEQLTQKRIFGVCFTVLGTKTSKCLETTLYDETKRYYRKVTVFKILRYRNVKTCE